MGTGDVNSILVDEGRRDRIVATTFNPPAFVAGFEVIGNNPRPTVNNDLRVVIARVN